MTLPHLKFTAENAEFAEKISFADRYLEKKRVWKRTYLHSISSALSVNSAVNLTMSSYNISLYS